MENKSVAATEEDKSQTANKPQCSLPKTSLSVAAAAVASTGKNPFKLCIDLESLRMLERLDNLRLDLQRTAPLGYREILTRETVVEYLIGFLLDEYDDGAGTNSVITQFKNELAGIKRDGRTDG